MRAGNDGTAAHTSVETTVITPEITSISIPKAGTSYQGKPIPVSIKGKNFKKLEPCLSFIGTGAEFTDFTIVSETEATTGIICPSTVTNGSVRIRFGSASKDGNLTVENYSGYDVGKIVLANKTLVATNSYTLSASNPPVGIICGDLYGVPRMVALHTLEYPEKWAPMTTTGYTTKFEGIICTPSYWGCDGSVDSATFTGDTDGSDNWEYIKQQYPTGTQDARTNYPAFYEAKTITQGMLHCSAVRALRGIYRALPKRVRCIKTALPSRQALQKYIALIMPMRTKPLIASSGHGCRRSVTPIIRLHG